MTVNFSPKYKFVFPALAYPAPSSITDSSLTWTIASLSDLLGTTVTLEYSLYYNPATGPLTIGDTVKTYATITPTAGDIDTTNNSYFVVDTIVLSHDPNEITVAPGGCLPLTGGSHQLEYTINFCNTGTDTAFNIVVLDTLSDNVNPKSLRIVSASAVMNVENIKSGGYNIVKFMFPNINLLDSSHHAQCNGAVIFTVNTLADLGTGSPIFNEAGIYFDNNAVVMTNEVENSIGCAVTATPVVTDVRDIKMFPNPATNELTISAHGSSFTAYSITNNLGQTMQANALSGSVTTTLNIKTLPPGIYYLRLTGQNGVEVRKFVKE